MKKYNEELIGCEDGFEKPSSAGFQSSRDGI